MKDHVSTLQTWTIEREWEFDFLVLAQPAGFAARRGVSLVLDPSNGLGRSEFGIRPGSLAILIGR